MLYIAAYQSLEEVTVFFLFFFHLVILYKTHFLSLCGYVYSPILSVVGAMVATQARLKIRSFCFRWSVKEVTRKLNFFVTSLTGLVRCHIFHALFLGLDTLQSFKSVNLKHTLKISFNCLSYRYAICMNIGSNWPCWGKRLVVTVDPERIFQHINICKYSC